MFKNILIPIDGSSLSYRPVAAAIDMARSLQGSLVLLSVAAPRLFNASDRDALHDGAAVEQENIGLAQPALDSAAEAASQAGVPCISLVAQSRTPCDEIVATARERQCDAIFMATRGRMDMLDALFDESTTQQVLQKSSVPVLVFPASG